MKITILFTILFFSFASQAGWFSDDTDKLCYDWYGNREACSRTQARRESLIAGQFNTYYGEETGSMVGSFSQGVVLSTVKSKDSLRFLFGGQLIFASANSFINNSNEIPTTMLSADLIVGASIKPFQDTYLKPVFEIAAIVGFKSIEFAGPPTGVEEKNLLPSYGGKLSVGIDIPISKLYAIRPALDYQITRVDGLIDNETFVLDALGISLGLVFQ